MADLKPLCRNDRPIDPHAQDYGVLCEGDFIRVLDEDGTVVIEGEISGLITDPCGTINEISVGAPMRLAWLRRRSRRGWRRHG